jgi:hypothetical protein
VLAYTFYNGFLSDTALRNIESAITKLNVDHIFFRPNWDLLKKLYRAVLLASGELCTVCGIGITNGYLKLSEAWHIPLILLGNKATETNSIQFEKIYDIKRFKTILGEVQGIRTEDVEHFLIYPDLHPYQQFLYTKIKMFGQILNPLFYIPQSPEDDIVELLSKEVGWQDAGKHSDCWAEPFSNFVREHRYGYSRRVTYYSNLIRTGELSRDKALELLDKENPAQENEKTKQALGKLDISRDELDQIFGIRPQKFQNYAYKRNRIIDKVIKVFG